LTADPSSTASVPVLLLSDTDLQGRFT
jgi:hypothetical protein